MMTLVEIATIVSLAILAAVAAILAVKRDKPTHERPSAAVALVLVATCAALGILAQYRDTGLAVL